MTANETVDAITKVLEFHLPDNAHDNGCARRCGYDGDDLAVHLAEKVTEVVALSDEAKDSAHVSETVTIDEEVQELEAAIWGVNATYTFSMFRDDSEILAAELYRLGYRKVEK